MKAFCLGLALAFSSPLLAGGAIGGSTGSCSQHIILDAMEFQRLVYEALTKGELIIQGEKMRVEALNLQQQVLAIRSVELEDSPVWILEVRDEE